MFRFADSQAGSQAGLRDFPMVRQIGQIRIVPPRLSLAHGRRCLTSITVISKIRAKGEGGPPPASPASRVHFRRCGVRRISVDQSSGLDAGAAELVGLRRLYRHAGPAGRGVGGGTASPLVVFSIETLRAIYTLKWSPHFSAWCFQGNCSTFMTPRFPCTKPKR